MRRDNYGNFPALLVSFAGTAEGLAVAVRNVFERLVLLIPTAIAKGRSRRGDVVYFLPAHPRQRSPYYKPFFAPSAESAAPFGGLLIDVDRCRAPARTILLDWRHGARLAARP